MTLWKDVERRIAKYFGGIRNPITGRAGKADVENNIVLLEIKEREDIPAWLRKALSQAKLSQEYKGSDVGTKYHGVILHMKGQKIEDDIAVLPIDVLKDMADEIMVLRKIRDDSAN